MNKDRAKTIARKMVRKRVSIYAGRITVSQYDNQLAPGKLMTPTAARKVLCEFYALAMNSPEYPVLQKMYAEEWLQKWKEET